MKKYHKDPIVLLGEILQKKFGGPNEAYEPKGVVEDCSTVVITIPVEDAFCYLWRGEQHLAARYADNCDQVHIARPYQFAAALAKALRLLRLEELLSTANIPCCKGTEWGTQVAIKANWQIVDLHPQDPYRCMAANKTPGELRVPFLAKDVRPNRESFTLFDVLAAYIIKYAKQESFDECSTDLCPGEFDYELGDECGMLHPFAQCLSVLGGKVDKARKELPFVNGNPLMNMQYSESIRAARIGDMLTITMALIQNIVGTVMECQMVEYLVENDKELGNRACVLAKDWKLRAMAVPPALSFSSVSPRAYNLVKNDGGPGFALAPILPMPGVSQPSMGFGGLLEKILR